MWKKSGGTSRFSGCDVYDKPLVYLDSGATAQKPECVIETVDRLHRESNANIHRGVHFLSEEATEMYEAARARIAEYIGAEAREEVVFTAGATASLNTVAYAWCERFLRAGDNIVVSEMEHHSNIVPWQLVAERKGAEIRVLPFDEEGRLMTERLPALLDGRTRVVAVTQASNTLGTRPDLRPVIDEAHAGSVRSWWWTDVRVSCTAVSMCRRWTAISTPSPVINSMPRRVSACCTASGICSTGCLRFSPAATWSIGCRSKRRLLHLFR